MEWWFGTSIIAIIVYAVLSAIEAYRCQILSSNEKLLLILLSLCVPIVGAYYSNRRLNFRISESGRSDLQLELPFWVVMGFPSKIKVKDADKGEDIDFD